MHQDKSIWINVDGESSSPHDRDSQRLVECHVVMEVSIPSSEWLWNDSGLPGDDSSFLESFLPIYCFPRRASNVLTKLTSPESKVLLSGFLPHRGISKQVCTSVKSLAVRLTLGLTPSLTQCKVGTMERGNSKPILCMSSKSLNVSQRPADVVEKYKAVSWIVTPSPRWFG